MMFDYEMNWFDYEITLLYKNFCRKNIILVVICLGNTLYNLLKK